METVCRLRVWQRPPMSTTRSSSSACSWLLTRSWPASGRCSPIRATTPNIIAICAASSVSRPRSTSEASRPAQGWASGAGPLNAATRGCWRTSVSPCATTGLASSSSRCCRAHASSWLQNASLANSENRLLRLVRYLRGTLTGKSDQLAANDQLYPIVEWRTKLKTVQIDDEGKYRFATDDTFTPKLGKGVLRGADDPVPALRVAF